MFQMESIPPVSASFGTFMESLEPRYRDFDEDGASAHLKPQRNAADGSKATRTKITHIEFFGMGIIGTVCSLMYGTWQQQPAALLVIEFGFRAKEGQRRYKRAEISATFEPLPAATSSSTTSSTPAAAKTYPVIRDFRPKNNNKRMGPSPDGSSSNVVEAPSQCPTQSVWPLHDFSVRGRHWTGQTAQEANQVIWTLRETEGSRVGICESVKLAVIVAHHGPFKATIGVNATTGVGLKVQSFPWSRDDPLLFDGLTPKGKQLHVSEFQGLTEEDFAQHILGCSSVCSSDSTLTAASDNQVIIGPRAAESRLRLPDHRQAKSTSAFRVRGIPSSFTRDSFVQSLSGSLGVEPEGIRIHTFAANPYRAEKMAIVSFAVKPDLLKEPQPTREWQTQLGLPVPESKTSRSSSPPGSLLFDTHFMGFSELGAGSEEVIDVDIIAVPGLGGHAYGSFKQRGGDYVWLEESLPHDLKSVGGQKSCHARILVYGYDSAVEKSDSFQSISDLAKRMRASLRAIREGSACKRPMIFIGHSLGGILIKELLILLSKGDDDDVANLKATTGALFFGVPNRGMDNSALLSIIGSQPNQELLWSLTINSPFLKKQSKDFPAIFSYRDSVIFSFFETRVSGTAKMTDGRLTMDGDPVVLVDRESATHSRPWEMDNGFIIPINRTHSDLTKFERYSDDYETVLSLLKGLVRTSGDVAGRRFGSGADTN